MTPKDPIETLLAQERLSEPTLQTDAEAFEAGVRQKIAQRRERRRSFQVAALVLCVVGVGTLSNLELSPRDAESQPVIADAALTNQPGSTVVETAVFEAQSDEWADDPFDSWDDEMPADYELVIDL